MKKAISSLAALFLVVTLALPASAASISDVANPESLYPVDINHIKAKNKLCDHIGNQCN